MSGRKVGGILVAVFAVIIVAALIDGGEEPLHPIEEAIELPESAR